MLEMADYSSKFSLESIASGKEASKRAFDLFLTFIYGGPCEFVTAASIEGLRVQDGLFLCECDEFY